MRRVFAILCVFSLLCVLMYIPTGRSGNEFQYVEAQHVHCTSDVYFTGSGWTPTPNDGYYWNKTLSNDGDTTQIGSGTAYAHWEMALGDIADNASLTNEVYFLSMWVIAKFSMGIPSVIGVIGFDKDTASLYSKSANMRGITGQNPTNTYRNYSIMSYNCPWTGLNWTLTTINQAYVFGWNAIGSFNITEIGVIVYTLIPYTPPASTDYNYIFLLALVCGLIAAVVTYGIIGLSKKG